MVAKCLKFGATWCAPCKALKPIFEKVSQMEEFKDIRFIEYDIEEEDSEDLVIKYGIRSVPTVVLLDENDNVLKKSIGSIQEEAFIEIVKSEAQ